MRNRVHMRYRWDIGVLSGKWWFKRQWSIFLLGNKINCLDLGCERCMVWDPSLRPYPMSNRNSQTRKPRPLPSPFSSWIVYGSPKVGGSVCFPPECRDLSAMVCPLGGRPGLLGRQPTLPPTSVPTTRVRNTQTTTEDDITYPFLPRPDWSLISTSLPRQATKVKTHHKWSLSWGTFTPINKRMKFVRSYGVYHTSFIPFYSSSLPRSLSFFPPPSLTSPLPSSFPTSPRQVALHLPWRVGEAGRKYLDNLFFTKGPLKLINKGERKKPKSYDKTYKSQ